VPKRAMVEEIRRMASQALRLARKLPPGTDRDRLTATAKELDERAGALTGATRTS